MSDEIIQAMNNARARGEQNEPTQPDQVPRFFASAQVEAHTDQPVRTRHTKRLEWAAEWENRFDPSIKSGPQRVGLSHDQEVASLRVLASGEGLSAVQAWCRRQVAFGPHHIQLGCVITFEGRDQTEDWTAAEVVSVLEAYIEQWRIQVRAEEEKSGKPAVANDTRG